MKKSLFILGIIAVLAISTVAFAHGGHFSGNRMNNRGPAGCYGYNNKYNQQNMGSYNNRGMRGQQDMRGMRNQQDMRGTRNQQDMRGTRNQQDVRGTRNQQDVRGMRSQQDVSGTRNQRNEFKGQRNNTTDSRNKSSRNGLENRSQVNIPDNIKSKFEEVRDLRLKMRQGFSSSSINKEDLRSMHQKIQDLNREIADWHFEQRIERFGN